MEMDIDSADDIFLFLTIVISSDGGILNPGIEKKRHIYICGQILFFSLFVSPVEKYRDVKI